VNTYSDKLKAVIDRARMREQDPVFRERFAEVVAEVEATEARERETLRRHGLQRSRVPEATWRYLEGPDETPAIVAAREFLAAPAEKQRFLTLAGPKGRGKTLALSWAVAKNGGRYYEAQELVQLSSFDRLAWEDLAAAQILAVDELGAEQGNSAFDANLYSVLNSRFRRCRKTLIGTNCTWPQFEARYLDREGGLNRLAERLVKGGKWVNLPGESMRAVGMP
jgi:DNA replication protein DnaC